MGKREVLDRLLALWEKWPALRFGQLISGPIRNENDLFYLEDGALLERLEATYEGVKNAS